MAESPVYRMFNAGAKGGSAEILMYDEIGFYGISDADFMGALYSLGDVDSITLRINSPGGDVFMGVAIYNALRQHPATITAQVDGVAASIATTIMMAANKITIADNAMVMIHNPMTVSGGDATSLRATAKLLDQVRDGTMVPAYRRSGKSVTDIHSIMDAETWYTASQAVAAGWVDSIMAMPTKTMSAHARYDLSGFKHAPAAISDTADSEAAIKARKRAENLRLAAMTVSVPNAPASAQQRAEELLKRRNHLRAEYLRLLEVS